MIKFVLGLWLAVLLNAEHMLFCRFSRAVILLPFIVPTALSAIAFWWLYDAQFSILSWMLMRMGLIHEYIDFLGDPWLARASVIAANIWRGIPFVAICLLAGLQTISPSLYEAAALDGASGWHRFRYRDAAAFDADHRGGDDVFGAVHVHRLPADLRADPRRTAECHAPDGDVVVPARDPRWQPGRRRRDRDRDGAVPARDDPAVVFRPAAAKVAAGRIGSLMNAKTTKRRKADDESRQGMNYLTTHPQRMLTLWLPLSGFLIVLLFPFYWMVITTIKPDAELLQRAKAIRSGSRIRRSRISTSCCSTPSMSTGCGTRC